MTFGWYVGRPCRSVCPTRIMFCDSPLWLTASASAAPIARVIAIAADNALRRHLPFVSECIPSPPLIDQRLAVSGGHVGCELPLDLGHPALHIEPDRSRTGVHPRLDIAFCVFLPGGFDGLAPHRLHLLRRHPHVRRRRDRHRMHV